MNSRRRESFMVKFAFLLGLMICDAATAQQSVNAISAVLPSLVRIEVGGEGPGVQGTKGRITYPPVKEQRKGVGIAISDRGHVLTAKHVLGPATDFRQDAQGNPIGRKITTRVPHQGGERVFTQGSNSVVFGNDGVDAALFRLGDGGSPSPRVALSSCIPRVNESVSVVVWRQNDRRRPIVGKVIDDDPETPNRMRVLFDEPIKDGDSGGPVIDSSNRIVGVVTDSSESFSRHGYVLLINDMDSLLPANLRPAECPPPRSYCTFDVDPLSNSHYTRVPGFNESTMSYNDGPRNEAILRCDGLRPNSRVSITITGSMGLVDAHMCKGSTGKTDHAEYIYIEGKHDPIYMTRSEAFAPNAVNLTQYDEDYLLTDGRGIFDRKLRLVCVDRYCGTSGKDPWDNLSFHPRMQCGGNLNVKIELRDRH